MRRALGTFLILLFPVGVLVWAVSMIASVLGWTPLLIVAGAIAVVYGFTYWGLCLLDEPQSDSPPRPGFWARVWSRE
jgi:hypothetical protein